MAQPRTFLGAVRLFVRSSPWLTPEDAPAVVALTAMARVLDRGELSPALLGAYGIAYRALLARKPPADPDSDDPLERALRDAGV